MAVSSSASALPCADSSDNSDSSLSEELSEELSEGSGTTGDGGSSSASSDDRSQASSKKRRGSASLYAEGKARAPYKKVWGSKEADLEDSEHSSDDEAPPAKSCGCRVVLSVHSESFQAMLQTDRELKKRQRYKPTGDKAFRDMKAQNEWLLSNIFDVSGNYLYCKSCVMSILGVSSQRLSRLRKVKRKEAPAEHGLRGKKSNRARTELRNQFITFVDASSFPNGRRIGSSSAEKYFDAVYSSIRAPSKQDKNYDSKIRRSVVGAFNLMQQSTGLPTVNNESARTWLKADRPSIAICPPKSDYCDTCKHYTEEISRAKTTLARLQESGSATEAALKLQSDLVTSYQLLLQEHRDMAQGCIEEYKRARKSSLDTWKRIRQLQAANGVTAESQMELADLKENFVCVIDADYQMTKLLPYWGYSAQPASTYYKQKLTYDNFGAVVHTDPANFFFLFHEADVGSKTADHTISCLDRVITSHIPAWVRHVTIVLDNAQVNKNQFTVGFLGQLVNSGRLQTVRLLLMIPGHTKFSPDEVFARVSHTYYNQDVFTGEELAAITSQYGLTYTLDASGIKKWRSMLPTVYRPVPNIKDLHDFVWRRTHPTERPQLEVRKLCSSGEYASVNTYVDSGTALVCDLRLNVPTYEEAGEPPGLSLEKTAHLMEMYDKWIPPERRLEILPEYVPPVTPAPAPTLAAAVDTGPVTSALAQERESQRATRECSTPGCSGQGHKNVKRWAEGHSTRSGCPIYHKVAPPNE